MPVSRSPRALRARARDGTASHVDDEAQPPPKRRKVFLQTMGEQLREMDVMRNSPPNQNQPFPNTRSVYFIHSVYDGLAADRRSRRQSIQTPESDVVPGNDGNGTTRSNEVSSKNLWTADEVVTTSSGVVFEDLIEWTQSYFDHWHPAFPFLLAPSTLQHFEHIVQNGVPNPESEVDHRSNILRSIMSISLADRRQSRHKLKPVPTGLVFRSFHDAIRSVGVMLAEETTLSSLQAVLSILLFLLSMLRYNAASRLEGLAVRMAFQLGLHRCPNKMSVFTGQEAELRQRVFWSLYCIDRSICPRLGLPLAIQDDDIDVCLPGFEEHGDNDKEGNKNHKLDLLIFLAGQAEFRGSITSLLYRAVVKDVPESDNIAKINAELIRWWNDVEDYLELNESEPHQINQFHQMVLLCLKSESIIALNRRAIATSRKSSAYNAALQNCVGAARTIIKTFSEALNVSANATSTALLWPSFTWAVWMSAFIMIYAANEDQVSRVVAIKHADKSLEILKNLSLRGSMWPDASIVAIREMREKLQRRETGNEGGDTTPQRGLGKSRGRALENNLLNHRHRSRDASQNWGTLTQPLQQDPDPLVGGVHVQDFSNLSTSHATIPNQPGSTTSATIPVSNESRQAWIPSQTENGFSSQRFDFGTDQQLLDLSLPYNESNDLFYGSDIPFWMGDDQILGMNGMNLT